MAQYPNFNDREFDLIKKITENTAEMADIEAGDVHTVAGTIGNVLVNGAVAPAAGDVVLSLPANVFSVTSIGIGTGTTAAASSLHVVDTGTASTRGILHDQYNNGTNSAQINTRKARGSFATPATIVTGDILGRHIFWGHDGTAFIESGNIRCTSSGTIGTNRVPSQLEFYTSTNANPSVLTLGLTLTSSQSATLAGNLTFGTSGSILNGTTGSIGLTATGTNQSITLTPSGTGQILIPSGANATPTLNNAAWGHANTGLAFGGSDAGAETVQWVYRGTASWAFGATAQTFYHPGAGVITADTSLSLRTNPAGANTHIFLPNSTNNVLLGGLTTDGTGVLQFPAAITSAGGITFGTDVNIYRSASNSVQVDCNSIVLNAADVFGAARFRSQGSSTGAANAVQYGIGNSAGNGMYPAGANTVAFATNSTLALTLDSSQNATFTGDVRLANAGGTSVVRSNANSLIFQTNGAFTALSLDTSQNVTVTNKIIAYNGIATAGNGVVTVQGAGRQTAQTGADASVATYTVGAADASFVVSANVNVTTATAHNFTVTVTYTDEGNTSRTLTLSFSQLAGTIINNITNVTGAGPYEGLGAHIRCKASTSITIATTGTFTTVTYNVEGNIRKLS